jgi:hypothetical protein
VRTPDVDEEFFIGYAPPMPPRLARFVRRAVLGVGGLVLVWAATLAAGHVTLEGGTFEFGHPAALTGTIVERPFPALRADGGDHTSWLLLVAPGKHGAGALVGGLNGQHVTLSGTRIQRGAHSMIEIEPASLLSSGSSDSASSGAPALLEAAYEEPVNVTGEIVDSKCFLGVMVPGSGKTHKDCASLCLRGGIPPAIHVEDRAGHSALLLLTGPSGEPVGAQALQVAGEAISVSGSVRQHGGWLVLATDPGAWRPVDR